MRRFESVLASSPEDDAARAGLARAQRMLAGSR
jgi:hypothetical protein